jgi:hypothetical protein
MEKSKWFEKAWSTVIAIPCVPVAYAWLAAEGPEWLRPTPGRVSPSSLEVAGLLLVGILIIRAAWCFDCGCREK